MTGLSNILILARRMDSVTCYHHSSVPRFDRLSELGNCQHYRLANAGQWVRIRVLDPRLSGFESLICLPLAV